MKLIITAILVFNYVCSIAQIKNGTYISTKESYLENYILVVEDSSTTYYGWLLNNKTDTVYFRARSGMSTKNYITFDDFEFTLEKITKDNLINFKAQPGIDFLKLNIHRHFLNIVQTDKRISVLIGKDIYDSRADQFIFLENK